MTHLIDLLREVERLIDARAYGNAATLLDHIKQLSPVPALAEWIEQLDRKLD